MLKTVILGQVSKFSTMLYSNNLYQISWQQSNFNGGIKSWHIRLPMNALLAALAPMLVPAELSLKETANM